MLDNNHFNQIVIRQRDALFSHAATTFHRQVLLIEGSVEWIKQYCQIFTQSLSEKNCAGVSPDKTNFTNSYGSNPNQIIGKEHDLFIYRVDEDFDANLFAVCSGTVKGNGIFVIAIPDNFFKKNHHDFFLMRFKNNLQQETNFHRISESSFSTAKFIEATSIPAKIDHTQQRQAIEMIKHVVTGHRKRPLVLLADRGRGKSAALGIAAAELVKLKPTKIIITAPAFANTAVTFKHIKQELPDYIQKGKSINSGSSSINFVAPDELIEKLPNTALLLIDEAAAIPSPMLEKLLKHYSRLVFATTLHGYEGSGKGFELRFFDTLEKFTPEWKKYKLTQPIRWASNDPLERFINRLFLLDAEISDIEHPLDFKLEACEIKKLSPTTLNEDEPLLLHLFSLLAVAHYRTKPSDLKLLLSHQDSQLYVVLYNNTIIATAFCLIEGNISPELAEQIYAGNRRPSGNLVPQSLIYHCGIKDAATLRCLRITRIATHPQLRNRGVATHLVNTIAQHAQTDGVDYLGTSFGATVKLVSFWRNLQFSCFRIGLKKEASSNSHALMMAKPLNNSSKIICESAQTHFGKSFYLLLSDELRYLDTTIAATIIYKFLNTGEAPKQLFDRQMLLDFTRTNRSYDSCVPILTSFITHLCETTPNGDVEVLIIKVLQKRSWQEITTHYNLNGKAEAIKYFKSTLSNYL